MRPGFSFPKGRADRPRPRPRTQNPRIAAGVFLSGRPVSRIRYPLARAAVISLGTRLLAASSELPMLALAPDRVFHGAPLGACPAWALTPRFQPYLAAACAAILALAGSGGVFSVALSLGLGNQAVARHLRSRANARSSCSRSPLATIRFLRLREGVFGLSSPRKTRGERPACLTAAFFQRRS